MTSADSNRLPLALTMGDPAGIGPEIIAMAFARHPEAVKGCLVVGDRAHLARALDLVCAAAGPGAGVAPVRLVLIDRPDQALAQPAGCLPLLPVGSGWGLADRRPCVTFGRVQAEAGRLAADAVVWAARAALRGEIAGLVTAPLHKEALAAAGIPYPGHTELLQAEAAAHRGCPPDQLPVRMMLVSDELRTVLVSIHLSLRQAIDAVTRPRVLETLRIAHQALAPVLGRAPRLAVAGLNPHAGEGGLFGREEIDILAPAIGAARAEGIDASGPHAPDTVFMRARQAPGHPAEFDAVVAMYHDQGLIPVKYLGLDRGVNVTLGLPLVRTSPDHGTAFDLAGTGRADPSSLVQALHHARQLGSPSLA